MTESLPGTAWLTVEGDYLLPAGNHVVVQSTSSTGSVVLINERIVVGASFGETVVLTVQSLSAVAGTTLAWIAQDRIDGRLVLDVWDVDWELKPDEHRGLTVVEAGNCHELLEFVALLASLPIRRRGRLPAAATMPSMWTGQRDHLGDARLYAAVLSYGRVLSWHPMGTADLSPTPPEPLGERWWTTDGLHRLPSGFEVDVRSNGPNDAGLYLERGLVVHVSAGADGVDGLLILLTRTIRSQSGASDIACIIGHRPGNWSAPLVIDDLSQEEDSNYSSVLVYDAAGFDANIAASDLVSYLAALSMLPMNPDPYAAPAPAVMFGEIEVGPVWRGDLNTDRLAVVEQTEPLADRDDPGDPPVAHILVHDLRVGPPTPTATVALNNSAMLTLVEHANTLLLELSVPDPVSAVRMPAAVTYRGGELAIESLPLGAGHIGCDRCNDHRAPQFIISTEQHMLYQYISALESIPVREVPTPSTPGDEYPAVWRGSISAEGAARIVQVRYDDCPPDSAIPTFADVPLDGRPFAVEPGPLEPPPSFDPPSVDAPSFEPPWYDRSGPLPSLIADGVMTTFYTASGARTGIILASSLRLSVEVRVSHGYPNDTSFTVTFCSLAPIVGPKVVHVVKDKGTDSTWLAVWDAPAVPTGLPHTSTAAFASEFEFERFIREISGLVVVRGTDVEADRTITYWAGTPRAADLESFGACWVTLDSAGHELSRTPAASFCDDDPDSYPIGALLGWTPLANGFGVHMNHEVRGFTQLIHLGRRMAIGRRAGSRHGEVVTSLVEVDDLCLPCANLTVEYHSGSTPFTLRRARHRAEEFHTSAVWAGSEDFTALMLMTPTVAAGGGYQTHAVWRGVMTENGEAVVERLDSGGPRPDVVAAVRLQGWRGQV